MLQALHEIVAQPGRRTVDPTRPNWDEICEQVGITPEMVRHWKQRTATETDIRRLLGEQSPSPGKREPDKLAEAFKELRRIVQTNQRHDTPLAEELAAR